MKQRLYDNLVTVLFAAFLAFAHAGIAGFLGNSLATSWTAYLLTFSAYSLIFLLVDFLKKRK